MLSDLQTFIIKLQYQRQHDTGKRTDKQINGTIENPEIDQHKYSQPILNKEGKAEQWSKDSLFNKYCQNIWTSTCKENESRHRSYNIDKN